MKLLYMKLIKLFVLGIFVGLSTTAIAQHSYSYRARVVKDKYVASLDSLCKTYKRWTYSGDDVLSNPYLFQMLSSPTFYGSAVNHNLVPLDPTARGSYEISSHEQERMAYISEMMACVYTRQPWLAERITGAADAMPSAPEAGGAAVVIPVPVVLPDAEVPSVPGSIAPQVPDMAAAPTHDEPETFMDDMNAFHIKVKKPNFWRIFGNFNFQMQQTYISDNWYKGGNNSYAVNGQFTIEANYNNKKKFSWDNKLEARLGFQTAEEYRITTFRPTSDLLRLTSKVGLQAHKHWFYTLSLQGWTQMIQTMDYYKDAQGLQRKRVKSAFLSPFEGVLSLGMDYKLEKKKFRTTVNIAPLALKHKYVNRDELAPSFGIDEGKNHKFSFGSTLTATASWAICKILTWEGRLYAFTDYKQHHTNPLNSEASVFGVTAEFENTFSLKINKYLSTRLFLFPRIDTTVPRVQKKDDDGNGTGEYFSYFQFKEYLSFGLDVSF